MKIEDFNKGVSHLKVLLTDGDDEAFINEFSKFVLDLEPLEVKGLVSDEMVEDILGLVESAYKNNIELDDETSDDHLAILLFVKRYENFIEFESQTDSDSLSRELDKLDLQSLLSFSDAEYFFQFQQIKDFYANELFLGSGNNKDKVIVDLEDPYISLELIDYINMEPEECVKAINETQYINDALKTSFLRLYFVVHSMVENGDIDREKAQEIFTSEYFNDSLNHETDLAIEILEEELSSYINDEFLSNIKFEGITEWRYGKADFEFDEDICLNSENINDLSISEFINMVETDFSPAPAENIMAAHYFINSLNIDSDSLSEAIFYSEAEKLLAGDAYFQEKGLSEQAEIMFKELNEQFLQQDNSSVHSCDNSLYEETVMEVYGLTEQDVSDSVDKIFEDEDIVRKEGLIKLSKYRPELRDKIKSIITMNGDAVELCAIHEGAVYKPFESGFYKVDQWQIIHGNYIDQYLKAEDLSSRLMHDLGEFFKRRFASCYTLEKRLQEVDHSIHVFNALKSEKEKLESLIVGHLDGFVPIYEKLKNSNRIWFSDDMKERMNQFLDKMSMEERLIEEAQNNSSVMKM